MDHLPIPADFQPPVIPYLPYHSPYRYGASTWLEFPDRNGYDRLKLTYEGDFTCGGTKSPNEAAAFLQEWLWFGLLSEFLEQNIDKYRFICSATPGVVAMNTSCLPYILTEWCRRTDAIMDKEAKSARFTKVEELLDAAQTVVAMNLAHGGSHESECPVSPEVALSIHLLAMTLTTVYRKTNAQGRVFIWSSSVWAVERMSGRGWCANTLPLLNRRLPAGLYFMAMLEPPSQPLVHLGCTESGCNMPPPDEDTYPVKHVEKDCPCPLRSISADEIAGAIERDMLPLVRFSRETDRPLEIIHVEYTDCPQYVAISHVWGDGLGNPVVDGKRENGLADCQITRLHQFLQNLPNPSDLFWMDTYCIPAQNQYRSQRRKAIANMRTIYSRANKVLILDAGLMQTCMHLKTLELAMRVLRSAWMGRLWTLQEGILNKQPFVQFKEGAINLNQLEDWIRHDLFSPRGNVHVNIATEAILPWTRMKDIVRVPPAFNLNHLYNAVQFRKTHHATDEALCLSILLGLDTMPITAIAAAPGESEEMVADSRMKEFFRLRRFLPVEFLLLVGERFNEDGYRWAPRSFIRRSTKESVFIDSESPNGEFRCAAPDSTAHTGLYCQLAGYQLNLDKAEQVNSIFWVYCQNVWYRIVIPDGSTEPMEINMLEKPAIIVTSKLAIGGLVDITNEEDGRYIAKYIVRVSIQVESADYITKLGPVSTGDGRYHSKYVDNKNVIVHGTKCSATQKWCIY